MKKSFFYYLKEGFALTNKSLFVFFVLVVFSFIISVPNYLGDSLFVAFLQFASYVFLFFEIGYLLSLPFFLLQRQQNKAVPAKLLLSTTLKNTKRSALLFIVVGILFILLAIIVAITVLVIAKPTPDQFSQSFTQWLPVIISFFIVFSSFFMFSDIYFSIENINIFSSLKKGFLFSIKHLRFIAVFAILNIVYTAILFSFPASPNDLFSNTFQLILSQYVSFITAATTLIYYQHHKTS